MSNRQTRDRIEAAIGGLTWPDRQALIGVQDSAHGRRVAAGLLRQAFAPELARAQEVSETLDRVRRLARQYPEDGAVPVRRILAALYGEESP